MQREPIHTIAFMPDFPEPLGRRKNFTKDPVDIQLEQSSTISYRIRDSVKPVRHSSITEGVVHVAGARNVNDPQISKQPARWPASSYESLAIRHRRHASLDRSSTKNLKFEARFSKLVNNRSPERTKKKAVTSLELITFTTPCESSTTINNSKSMNDLQPTSVSPINDKRGVIHDVSSKSQSSYKLSPTQMLKIESVQVMAAEKKRTEYWTAPGSVKSPPPRIDLVMDFEKEESSETVLCQSFNSGFRGLGSIKTSENRETYRKRISMPEGIQNQVRRSAEDSGPARNIVITKSSEEINGKSVEAQRSQGSRSPIFRTVITKDRNFKHNERTKKERLPETLNDKKQLPETLNVNKQLPETLNDNKQLPKTLNENKQLTVTNAFDVGLQHVNGPTVIVENDDDDIASMSDELNSLKLVIAKRMKKDICNTTFIVSEKSDENTSNLGKNTNVDNRVNKADTDNSLDLKTTKKQAKTNTHESHSPPCINDHIEVLDVKSDRSIKIGSTTGGGAKTGGGGGANSNATDILVLDSHTPASLTDNSSTKSDGKLDANHHSEMTRTDDATEEGGVNHKRHSVVKVGQINQKKAYDRFARTPIQRSVRDHTSVGSIGSLRDHTSASIGPIGIKQSTPKK